LLGPKGQSSKLEGLRAGLRFWRETAIPLPSAEVWQHCKLPQWGEVWEKASADESFDAF